MRPLTTKDLPPTPEFEVGRVYERMSLHNAYLGNRQKGITGSSEHPIVFVFNLDSGDRYGYEDEFVSEDRFVYTGQGRVGDQKMEDENRVLRDHEEEGKAVHLFEEVDYFDSVNDRTVVTHVGEFRYVDHRVERLPDVNGDMRNAFRFTLERVGEDEVDLDGLEEDDLSVEDLFQAARGDTSSTSERSSDGSGESHTSRSELVKRFALRSADGVCQGCLEDAPFVDENGDPFLEVHHLTRVSDGGPDEPENVVALCPNCHRRVHRGADGTEFNSEILDRVKQRNERLLA
jgi:5-methylcytosine-specific restriction protein A